MGTLSSIRPDARLRRPRPVKSRPGLSFVQGRGSRPYAVANFSSFAEKGAQGSTIGTFSQVGATTPSAISLSNVVPANAVQINADGVTLEYGSTFLDFLTTTVVTFTTSFTDALGGPYTNDFIMEVVPLVLPAGGDVQLNYTVPVDDVASTLSSPTATNVGSTGFSGSVSIDLDGNGVLEFIVQPAALGAPSLAQIEAGLDASGAVAPGGLRTQAVTATGVQNVSGSGLTAATSYKVAYVHRDNAGNPSNVVLSASLTTAAGATAPAQMSAPTLDSTCTKITITKAADPADGGSAITSIEYRTSTDGGSSWSAAATLTSPQTIPGFTPGATGVLVQTRAVNAVDANPNNWSTSASIDMKIPVLVGQKTFGVGAVTGDKTISLTDLTGGIDTQPSAGDVVVIFMATGSIASRAIAETTGTYTTLFTKIYNNLTEDLNFYGAYKVMGSTPDTTATVTWTLNSADAGAVWIEVWRLIDPANVLDVAVVTTTGNNGQPVPGASTPVTQHAPILVVGGGAAGNALATAFTSSDLSAFQTLARNNTHSVTIGGGHKDWTSGAFTAAQFGGGTTTAGNARAAASVALRPI